MRQRVHSDLVYSVAEERIDPIPAQRMMDPSGLPDPTGLCIAAAVEVECALHTIFIQDRNKSLILLHTVVIAEGQRLRQASGESHMHFSFHFRPPPLQKLFSAREFCRDRCAVRAVGNISPNDKIHPVHLFSASQNECRFLFVHRYHTTPPRKRKGQCRTRKEKCASAPCCRIVNPVDSVV